MAFIWHLYKRGYGWGEGWGWGGWGGGSAGMRLDEHKHGLTFKWLKPLGFFFLFFSSHTFAPLQPVQMHFRYSRWRASVLQMSQLCPATSLTVTLLLCVFTARMTTTNTDTAGNRMIHMVSFCCCWDIHSSLAVSVITVMQIHTHVAVFKNVLVSFL